MASKANFFRTNMIALGVAIALGGAAFAMVAAILPLMYG